MSVRKGMTFCDLCLRIIEPASKLVILNGNKHYHARHDDDCWSVKVQIDETTIRFVPT